MRIPPLFSRARWHRLALTVAIATLAACQQRGSEQLASLPTSGILAVVDSSALVCRELFRPGDSLPPQINAASVGPSGLIAWQPVGKSILIIRSTDGHETRIDGMAGASRFASVAQMGWNGDTLWVTDIGSNRVQRFGADGRPLGVLLAPDIAGWRLLPNGEIRATAPRGFDSLGVSHATWALIGAKPGARRLDTIATIPSAPWSEIVLPAGPELNPLSISTMAGMSLDGARWCVTQLASNGVHLVCLDSQGAPLLDRALQLPQRTVTTAIYNAVVATLPSTHNLGVESLTKLFPRPDSLPFAFAMRFGHDGAPWLLRTYRSEPVQVWLRLKLDGTPQDEIQLPGRFFLLDFAGDSLWVAEREAASFQRLSQCVVRR